MMIEVHSAAAELEAVEASGAAIALLLLDVLFDEQPAEVQLVASAWRAAAGPLLDAA